MAAIDYALVPLHDGDASLDLLSGDERARAARFVRVADRLRWVRARRALRVALGRRLGAAPASIGFRYGLQGKPAIAAPHDASGLRFSLAHSGDLALVAFADGFDIGVDVERIRAAPHAPAIAVRLFPPAAAALIAALTGEGRDAAFFRAWTRHEAIQKCLGGSVLVPEERVPAATVWDLEVPVPAGFVAAAAAAAAAPGPALTYRPLYSAG